jgi:hypothetical protein
MGCSCLANTYLDTGEKTCASCPENSESEKTDYSESELSTCTCNTGYTWTSDDQVCEADSGGDDCEAGEYLASSSRRVGGGSCRPCPSGTSSDAGSDALTDCTCLAGYTADEDGARCSECEAGTYKSATGAGACTPCPSGTSSDAGSDELTDCTCLKGYTADQDGSGCVSEFADAVSLPAPSPRQCFLAGGSTVSFKLKQGLLLRSAPVAVAFSQRAGAPRVPVAVSKDGTQLTAVCPPASNGTPPPPPFPVLIGQVSSLPSY